MDAGGVAQVPPGRQSSPTGHSGSRRLVPRRTFATFSTAALENSRKNEESPSYRNADRGDSSERET
jgi:hypothetical protein